MRYMTIVGWVLVLLFASAAIAQVPQTISYQGVLKDNTGAIVPDDDYDFTFKIYNVATGGAALWMEMQTKHVTAGILNVTLGEVTPIDLPFHEQYWLGVAIGAGPELTPRTKLTGAPYSLNAQAVRGGNIFPQSGDVGIGTNGPVYPLQVVSDNIHPLRIDGTAIGSWSNIQINAAGSGSQPGIEYLKAGSLKATTYVGIGDNWNLRMAGTDVLTLDGGTHNFGIGETAPAEKLDVDGAVNLGNTANTNAGTIRWTGSDFEGYDGSTWHSLTATGSGSLPPGTAGQTLRHNGTDWASTSFLYNDGSHIGIGTSIPTRELHIYNDVDDAIGISIDNPNTGANSTQRIDFDDENGTMAGLVIFDDNNVPYPSEMHLFNNRPGALLVLNAGSGSVNIKNDGNVGVGTKWPEATLHVVGGNWDLDGTEGDLKVGDSTYRLKVGVATGGGGAGTAGIRVQGGEEKLVLGAGAAEVLWVHNDGTVDIGSDAQTGELNLYRELYTDPVARLYTNVRGGNLNIHDESYYTTAFLQADADGEGGYLAIYRDIGATGLDVDGNYGGTHEPRVTITGSSRSAVFSMGHNGDGSVELPADAIAADEIMNETGTASAVNGTGVAVLGASPMGLLSRSITVPDSGYVMVVGTCEARANHTTGTDSDADFGVSEDFTFPSNQDFRWSITRYANSGYYYAPITVHGLFEVETAGTYTYYFLGAENAGDITVYDRQLTLVYIPTAYGTVSPTLALPGETIDESPVVTEGSLGEIDTERMASEAANRERMERELREMNERLIAIERELARQTERR